MLHFSTWQRPRRRPSAPRSTISQLCRRRRPPRIGDPARLPTLRITRRLWHQPCAGHPRPDRHLRRPAPRPARAGSRRCGRARVA
ncbi:hypothetical protein QJS66_19985 [Kocuria rhizophila]|nr:hypothetical protein QJS66_19985 [Kocuria rhizophila]